ncbi:hypothetical protein [Ferrimonas kyonanensis]|uniref:hypothetical protein n=1 Tax=Ferrimonas kyonanensis TaxID=364763 RepID=UPI000419C69B|nr:hypothetical protein [Ferrimonas kyonanensis]
MKSPTTERRDHDRRSHKERRGEVRFEEDKADRRHLSGRRSEDRLSSKIYA